MSVTIADIVRETGAVFEGDDSIQITGVSGLQDAREGDLSFLANPKYSSQVAGTRASAVIVSPDWTGECAGAVLKVENPDAAFAVAAAMILPPPVRYEPGIHASAVVADDAVIGDNVTIGPLCVIEKDAKIGDGTVICAGTLIGREAVIGRSGLLHPNVTVRDRMIVGDRVIIHSGAVIGSDGFGYSNNDGKWKKIPQAGIVEIGDDVEIGANATVDRARFGRTIISDGVKIDNLVQIAHNVVIGENTAMAAQVGVSGSTRIGKNCQVGGQAGLAGHIHVGDNAILAGQSGTTKDVKPGTYVWGTPAMPMKKFLNLQAHLGKLPELKKKIKELEQRIRELESGQ